MAGLSGLNAARASLAASGRLRVRQAVDGPVLRTWREFADRDEACPAASVGFALSGLGKIDGIDWWDEAAGLPPGAGFILDLVDRASEEGGLLMVDEGEGRVSGWRPEAGALTVFEADQLILTPVRPGASVRRAIIGRLA